MKYSDSTITSTITRKISSISSLYNFGVKIGYFEEKPMQAVIRPKVDITSQDRFLTKEEATKLLGAFKKKPKNFLIGIVLLTTGLRANQLVNIRWKDFYEDAKGNIALRTIRKRNNKSVVKITRVVWSYILNYRISLGEKIELDPMKENYLFTTSNDKPLSERYLRELIKRYIYKLA